MAPPVAGQGDPALFAEALAALDHEQPTRQAELRFELLNGLYWSALGLTVLYAVQVGYFRVTLERARPIAILAACVYALIGPASYLNLAFFKQLRRVAWLHRRLSSSQKAIFEATINRRRGIRVLDRVVALGLTSCGWLALAFGTVGLLVETFRRPFNPGQFILALLVVFFGLTSMLIPYMAGWRERLRVIAELHAALVAGKTSALDLFALLQRRGIQADRKWSIRANAARPDTPSYGYRESSAVRIAKGALTPTQLVAVLAHVDRLLADAPGRKTTGDGSPDIFYDHVPETELELGYRVDQQVRQVNLVSLAREGDPRPTPEDDSDRGSVEYKINRLPTTLESERKLPAEKRQAADQLIGALAEHPSEYADLAMPDDDGTLVLRRSVPPVAVTFKVDNVQKAVDILHVSAPNRARHRLFVSYSRDDAPSYKQVMTFVRSLETDGLVDIWSDERIRAGDKWKKSIDTAIDSADAALLLVSQNFMDSEFVKNVELPRLLDRAEKGLTKIFWVAIRKSRIKSSQEPSFKKLTEYQSLFDPETPLNALAEAQQDTALVEICERLSAALLADGGGDA